MSERGRTESVDSREWKVFGGHEQSRVWAAGGGSKLVGRGWWTGASGGGFRACFFPLIDQNVGN